MEMFLIGVPVCLLLLAHWSARMLWANHKGTLTSGGLGSRRLWPTLSEPSMNAYAKAVTANPHRQEHCQWSACTTCVTDGAARITRGSTGEIPGSAGFETPDLFLHDNKGFLWSPSGEPEETADDSYRHLKDRWYGYEGWDHW